MIIPNAITPWLDEEEGLLAYLCTLKVAKLLQGMLSIGIPSLVTGVPDPERFFLGQFLMLDAHAVVLHTISGRLHETERTLRLRQHSADLRQQLRCLQRELDTVHLAGIKRLPVSLDRVADAAVSTCDQLAAYMSCIGVELELIADIKQMVIPIGDAMPSLIASMDGA